MVGSGFQWNLGYDYGLGIGNSWFNISFPQICFFNVLIILYLVEYGDHY